MWHLNKMNEVTVCVTDGVLTEGQQNSKCRCSLGLCLCLEYRSSQEKKAQGRAGMAVGSRQGATPRTFPFGPEFSYEGREED